MASRRARVKVAPKLTLGRTRAKPVNDSKIPVVKETSVIVEPVSDSNVEPGTEVEKEVIKDSSRRVVIPVKSDSVAAKKTNIIGKLVATKQNKKAVNDVTADKEAVEAVTADKCPVVENEDQIINGCERTAVDEIESEKNDDAIQKTGSINENGASGDEENLDDACKKTSTVNKIGETEQSKGSVGTVAGKCQVFENGDLISNGLDKNVTEMVDASATEKPVPINGTGSQLCKVAVIEDNPIVKLASIQNCDQIATKVVEEAVRNVPIDSDWEDEEFTYNSIGVDEISPELTALINKATAEVVLQEDHNVDPKNNTVSTPSPAPSNSRVRMPPCKNKFKPNLFTDRRSRKYSGSFSSRVRSISGSGTDSDNEGAGSSLSPVVQNGPSTPTTAPAQPIASNSEQGVNSPKPARIRRVTETRNEREKSQFMKRKQEHKRRFMRGVPERGNMTMFDLIYYNPENGPRMSIDEDTNEQEKTDTPEPENVAPATVVDAEPDTPPRTPPPPVPQVIVVNGEIVVDDSSLVLETTEAKKAKEFLQSSPLAVVENNKTSSTNYGTWSKKRRHVDWSEKETLRFYKALSVVGSDFSMMESVFKKKRTRQELKLKFKKEERLNAKMVDKCLRERGMYTELEGIMEDSEEDSDVEMVPPRDRKKVTKKRSRGRYKNRGYYDSSSGGEEADSETSRSPARKKPREVLRSKRRNTPPRTPPRTSVTPMVVSQSSITSSQATTNSTTGVQFPPGLLAANPGLVGARPGSLVVVASPSKIDPSSQLLHVYMVSSRQKAAAAENCKDKIKTPSGVSASRTPSPRITLDPAVVRAVDRTRLAEREGVGSRLRTFSESKDPSRLLRSYTPSSRQRTCSEGSGNVRRELVRQRFLSGSTRSEPNIEPTLLATSTIDGSFACTISTSNTSTSNLISTSTVSVSNRIVNSTTTSTQPIARKLRPIVEGKTC